jgi:hypothetical protein
MVHRYIRYRDGSTHALLALLLPRVLLVLPVHRFLYRVGKGGWAAGEQEYSITIKSGDTVTWVARYVDNNAGSGHRYFTSSSDCK